MLGAHLIGKIMLPSNHHLRRPKV